MILWMVCYTYRFQFILFINYKKLIMKKNFIIFRHEKTDRPEQQTLSEWLKSGLNEEGSERSLVLADNLKQYGIELIYSSPRLRTYQTAELAGFKLGIPVYTDKRLDEINLGLLGDMTYDEISRYYPELWANRYDCASFIHDAAPGGESKYAVRERIFDFLYSLLRTPEQAVGIASHELNMVYFLTALGYSGDSIDFGRCFVVEYDYGGECFRLK